MGQMAFQHADAWIFVSLAFYQGDMGTSLRDLFATADYINHAAPTAGEIEGAQNGEFVHGPAGSIDVTRISAGQKEIAIDC